MIYYIVSYFIEQVLAFCTKQSSNPISPRTETSFVSCGYQAISRINLELPIAKRGKEEEHDHNPVNLKLTKWKWYLSTRMLTYNLLPNYLAGTVMGRLVAAT